MINVSEEFCPAIIVMAKAPRPGEAKTRLQPLLDEKQAAELAACFLQDIVKKVRGLTTNVIIGFTPVDGKAALETLIGKDLLWTEQKGKDLGERMASTIEFAEKEIFSPIIVIGTDSPTLPLNYIEKALEYFRDDKLEIVLGPSNDGGYYLIGMRKLMTDVFENIDWSSSKVFDQTLANIEKTKILNIGILDNWYDVDTPEDLIFLRNELILNEELRQNCPQTFHWLTHQESLFSLKY